MIRPPARHAHNHGAHPSDLTIAALILPLLLAACLGLVPFTLFSTFLVPIAEAAGTPADALGSLRGFGGVAAIAAGTAAARLLDRVPRTTVLGAGAILLAAACAAGLLSSTTGWLMFCLLTGAGTALLNPAASALAADRFTDPDVAARAATLVSTCQTITTLSSAVLLAWPAARWGVGSVLGGLAVLFVITAGLAIAALRVRRGPAAAPAPAPAPDAARLPRSAHLMLAVSGLRTLAFMGYLTFLAVLWHERFGWQETAYVWIWSLSGLCFFLASLVTGRVLLHLAHQPRMLNALAVAASLLSAGTVFALPGVGAPIAAAACTALIAAAHAVIAACVTTRLVATAGAARGRALSLNGVVQSLGTFGGAALGGWALSSFGWPGYGAAFAIIMLIAAVLALPVPFRRAQAE